MDQSSRKLVGKTISEDSESSERFNFSIFVLLFTVLLVKTKYRNLFNQIPQNLTNRRKIL